MSQNLGFNNPDLAADSRIGFKYDTNNPNLTTATYDKSLSDREPPPYSAEAPPQPPPPPNLNRGNQYAYNNSPNATTATAPAGTNSAGWGQFDGAGALSDKNIRIRFIRKVYLIVGALLLWTFGIVCIFVFVTPVNNFAKTTAGLALYIISAILYLALIITFAICSCTKGVRKVPYNYIILFCIATTLAIMLGFVSAYHTIQAVLIAVGITFVIVAGVTAFSMQTRFDFTRSCWLVAICLMFALFGFGIACIFVRNNILQGVYGGIGALVMAIFLAIDTQMIVGGKRLQYSEEDYANAALQLYIDICYIFMYILQIMGAANK